MEPLVTQLNGKICHRHVLGKIESSDKADKHQSHLKPQDSQQLRVEDSQPRRLGIHDEYRHEVDDGRREARHVGKVSGKTCFRSSGKLTWPSCESTANENDLIVRKDTLAKCARILTQSRQKDRLAVTFLGKRRSHARGCSRQ